jgi:cobalamin biosynthetic protein CobC
MSDPDGDNGAVYHGGSLTEARALFPGAPEPFLDLSTGINPHTYPAIALPASAFTRLPEPARLAGLEAVAASAYGAPSPAHVAAAPGTQALLPLVAGLAKPGMARILSPTYSGHEPAARLAGHAVETVAGFEALAGADLAIVVNPNNPDGRIVARDRLLELAADMRRRGGLLVVDEAFMDVGPEGASLADCVHAGGLVVLRSFGKFFGLAGVRLGFALCAAQDAETLRHRLGAWAISGPALEYGITALADSAWQAEIRGRLAQEAARLDACLASHGVAVIGGTGLFRYVGDERCDELFRVLGGAGIFVRRFRERPGFLRFGLPPDGTGWQRLEAALALFRKGFPA